MTLLPPKQNEIVIKFNELDKTIVFDKLFEWGLISKTEQTKQKEKTFNYYPSKISNSLKCSIVGYIEYESQYDKVVKKKITILNTVVISINGQLHKIMPQYLKEMQKSDFKNDVENLI